MTVTATDTAPSREQERVAAVQSLDLIDTAPEERFDKIVRMAQELFDVPLVAINLIDEKKQFTKAATLDAWASRTAPREESFCSTTIGEDGTLVVVDATEDPRFKSNPMVTGKANIRFYAGHPLTNHGQRVGALCLVDSKPRTFTETEQRMLSDLATWVERELAREEEMSHASEIQRSLLPRHAPTMAGYDIAGECLAAGAVGGDFYEWGATENGLSVILADVMGKGVGPALLAAGLRGALRATFTGTDIGADFNHVASSVEPDLTATSTFITAFAAQIDPLTGLVSFVDAGHGLGMIIEPDGTPRRLPTTGLPLGVMTGDSWAVQQQQLRRGETLVIVSDGILDVFDTPTAALNRIGELVSRTKSANEVVEAILALSGHGTEGQDDLTVVTVRRSP
jgi:sigma-B regulation protein RsbU (phosphoserine phosphatase)